MEYKSEEKAAMAGQPNPPPYQEDSSMGYSQPGQQFAGNPQPYPGQPYPGQPYPGQPYPGQPYPGQPYPGQPYPGQPYPGEFYAGQTVIALQPQAPLSPPENDYLGYSIFTLLCCCMPLGIAAVIYSIFTRQANSSGNRGEAERSSRCARTLNHTAVGLGLVFIIIYIVYLTV
ncbi:uncharacterized protein [Eucyclogobius newberryi]|uniref:uncharacterized protein isoform X2 n=1 Tax=Eucyclogobius newberryi TaxID=166745 RepID=UPI003B596A67